MQLFIKPRDPSKSHNRTLIKNKITYVKQEWGYLCRFKLPTHIFIIKERKPQRSGTYIAYVLQKLTVFIPARGVNSGFSIGLGGEHLTCDRFKIYIDQGVHFQIIISKSILLTYSLSPVCKAKMFWNAAGPTNFTSNYFTAWECMHWASAHHSNVIMFSVLGKRPMNLSSS